jgi:adenylate kinase
MAEAQRYRSILIFGPPGSGKGTQGKVLGRLPGFFHLACGDVFRALDPESELGKIFRQYSTQGKLVPDSYTVRLWREHVQKLVQAGQCKPAEQILLLDGIPRNRNQAEIMAPDLEVLLLVYLEAVDQEQMVARLRRRALQENRKDDADESVIRRRFREYEAESAPVLEYYPANLIRKVDAGAAPLEVLHRLVEAVQKGLPGR